MKANPIKIAIFIITSIVLTVIVYSGYSFKKSTDDKRVWSNMQSVEYTNRSKPHNGKVLQIKSPQEPFDALLGIPFSSSSTGYVWLNLDRVDYEKSE